MSYNQNALTAPRGVSVAAPYPLDFIVTAQMFGAVGDGVADDTAAIQAAINYAATVMSGAAVFFNPGTYLISSPLVFKCSLQGCTAQTVVIKAKVGFVGSYMLDFNGSKPSQFISKMAFSMAALGAAATVTAFGSSSAGGGGGGALCVFDQITISSNSNTRYALQMSSTVPEPGALTGSVWTSLIIFAPKTISIGNNQDDMVFLSPRFQNAATPTAGPPFDFSGSDIVIMAPYFGVAADVAATGGLINIGPNPVTFINGFLESTLTLVNAKWLFQCISAGRDASNEASLHVDNFELNVSYGGGAEQALVRVNTPNALTNSCRISLNGIRKSAGGGVPWDTLFNVFNATVSATGPIYLTIKDVDEFPQVSVAGAGGNASGGGVVLNLQGWWQGRILNHTASQPPAGSRLSFVWVVGANFGPA